MSLKLGVTPWDFRNPSARKLTEQAVRAEGLGYHSIWVPENHFGPNAIPDPLMWLASVAAATSRLRLGTTSFLLPLRNPLQAAEQVAVLDQLSEGRVVLGIGRGYAAPMLRAFNVAPASKRRLFEETLALMQQAWSGAPVAVPEHPEEALVLNPLPVQRPHPPLWVAAFGPKALTQAGRLGLPYLASPVESLETLRDNYRVHRAALQEAEQPPPAQVPLMRTLFVTDEPALCRRVRDSLASLQPIRPGAPAADLDDWAVVGDRAYVVDRIAAYRETLGLTDLIVTRLRLDGLSPEMLERSIALAAELLG